MLTRLQHNTHKGNQILEVCLGDIELMKSNEIYVTDYNIGTLNVVSCKYDISGNLKKGYKLYDRSSISDIDIVISNIGRQFHDHLYVQQLDGRRTLYCHRYIIGNNYMLFIRYSPCLGRMIADNEIEVNNLITMLISFVAYIHSHTSDRYDRCIYTEDSLLCSILINYYKYEKSEGITGRYILGGHES